MQVPENDLAPRAVGPASQVLCEYRRGQLPSLPILDVVKGLAILPILRFGDENVSTHFKAPLIGPVVKHPLQDVNL